MPTLDWLDRERAFKRADEVPYRLLESVSSHGDPNSGNLLIQGDNLDALKALLPLYRGRVKCIYIDPPYNTRSAFEHYDDNLEHSQWLSMMYPRLVLLRELLAEDGSIWVSIDDNEGHYLKVLMDEAFGRKRFIAANIWQKRYSRDNNSAIGDVHDYILTYAIDPEKFKATRNLLGLDDKSKKPYRNPNNDPLGPWRPIPMNGEGYRPNQMYGVTLPSGRVVYPPEGRHWAVLESEFLRLKAEGRIYFGKGGDSQPNVIRYLREVPGLVPWTWWPHEEVGHTDEAKKESIELFGAKAFFGTPKPERLIRRMLEVATREGDLILDSFLGSGTSVAVAQKMNRRYIGIEMGEHATTHCLPRLQKVVDGEQGGISESVGWKGGGGFKFLRLGERVFDEHGAINPKVRFATLASFIWHQETGLPASQGILSPLLGVHGGTAYYLLYNGILGDKRPEGGNVLTGAVLDAINKLNAHEGPRIVYGESCRLGEARLREAQVTFRHIPYDVRAR